MKEPILLSPGVFPDIAFAADGAIVVAYRVHERRADGWIEVRWLGGHTFPIATGLEDSSFCRLCAWQGRLWLLYRALRAGVASACLRELFADRLGMERPLGQASGSSPVCFGDGWGVWQNVTDGVVWGLNLEAGGDRVLLRDTTRPTGLSRLWHGGVRFIDEDRFLLSPDMQNPVFAGQAVVGEGQNGGLAVRLAIGKPDTPGFRDVRGFIMEGECNVPRVAWDGAGRYVAVTWGGPGVRVLEFDEADIGPLPVTMAAIGRPLWLGWYVWGTDNSVPANCELRIHTGGMIRPRDAFDGPPIAQYVAAEEDGTVDGLERAILDARRRQPWAPVLAYWPRKLQTAAVPSADYVGVEAYRLKAESLGTFEARVRAAVARCRAPWIVSQGYTQPEPSEQTVDLAPLVPIYNRVAKDYVHVAGLLVFSAGLRDGGWNQHPEIHDIWRALAAGIPSAPILLPVDPTWPDPPPPPDPDPDPDEPDPKPDDPTWPGPDPVDPDPNPEPDPIEKEDPMIAYAAPVPGFLPGEIVDHQDGGGMVAVKKPNGKFLCVTPQGAIEERDNAGSWEAFKRGKTSLVAEREGKIYVLPLAGE